jgi:hypothetical protein
MVRAEHKLALKLYANIVTVGERTNDSAVILLGHFLHGHPHCYMGDFSAARTLYESAIL